MTAIRLLLAVSDPELGGQLSALAREGDDLEIVGVAGEDGEVTRLLGRCEVDVVLLHEALGPLPTMDFTRELASSHPHVAVVLVVDEETPEVLRGALGAGARGVLASPFSFETLDTAVRDAARWAEAVRGRLSVLPSDGDPVQGVGASMVAVAGAKGGVGASTVAVQLALAAAAEGDRSVCLVDLDLQAGDLRLLLDLPFRRSVVDLVSVADDLSAHRLDEALYTHGSGLRVLLAPEQGERAEEVPALAARQILGALRLAHDLVIVDVGTVVSEANALAVELADEVLIVTTPDVPALRAANRLAALWRRLQIREDEVTAVLNRASKDSEIQTDMARKVLEAPLAKATIPAGFRALEAAANTGVPSRASGAPRDAIVKLAGEVGALAERSQRRRGLSLADQAGQAATETTGMILVIAICLLGMWQIVLVGTTYVLSGHAAREGARAMAVGDEPDEVREVAGEDVPGAWRDGMEITPREEEAEVRVALDVPVVIPGVRSGFQVTTAEGTVIEGEPLPEEVEG